MLGLVAPLISLMASGRCVRILLGLWSCRTLAMLEATPDYDREIYNVRGGSLILS